MELENCTATLVYNDENVTVTFSDPVSGIEMMEAQFPLINFVRWISGSTESDCSLSLSEELNKVNKKLNVSTHEFEIPYGAQSALENIEDIRNIALKTCPEGWVPDQKYTNKSFYSKDFKTYAKVAITTWK